MQHVKFSGLISEPVIGWYNLQTLPVKKFTFINASSRYLTYGTSTVGPYDMDTKLIKNIDGIDHVQSEAAYSSILKYSDNLASWAAVKQNVTVGTNVIASPIGTLTADKYLETDVDGVHGSTCGTGRSGPFTSGKQYVFSVYCKAAERTKFYYIHDTTSFSGNSAGISYDFTTDTLAAYTGTLDWMYRQLLDNGWVYVAFANTSTGGTYTTMSNFMMDGALTSYQGVLNYGMYFWGFGIKQTNYVTSYIPTTSTLPVVKNADVWSCSNVGLPSWLKGASSYPFCFRLRPYYSSTQLSTNAGKKYIFSIKATDNVECYLDGADNKLKIDVGGVNKFTSTVKSWDRYQGLIISIIPTIGSSCQIAFSGFTSGNGTETGTNFSLQTDGKFYLGCLYDTYDKQFDGLLSEPIYGNIAA